LGLHAAYITFKKSDLARLILRVGRNYEKVASSYDDAVLTALVMATEPALDDISKYANVMLASHIEHGDAVSRAATIKFNDRKAPAATHISMAETVDRGVRLQAALGCYTMASAPGQLRVVIGHDFNVARKREVTQVSGAAFVLTDKKVTRSTEIQDVAVQAMNKASPHEKPLTAAEVCVLEMRSPCKLPYEEFEAAALKVHSRAIVIQIEAFSRAIFAVPGDFTDPHISTIINTFNDSILYCRHGETF
jgi:ribosome biogenesis SPOUT family RNA methylase Rps3